MITNTVAMSLNTNNVVRMKTEKTALREKSITEESRTMNKVYEERINNKYRYFVGEETKDKDGIKKFVHKSGYFKTRKDAEKKLKEMERM